MRSNSGWILVAGNGVVNPLSIAALYLSGGWQPHQGRSRRAPPLWSAASPFACPAPYTDLYLSSGLSGLARPFPLTPCPLPKERENTRRTVARSKALGLFESRTPGAPSPRGEGRGEGEWISHIQTDSRPMQIRIRCSRLPPHSKAGLSLDSRRANAAYQSVRRKRNVAAPIARAEKIRRKSRSGAMAIKPVFLSTRFLKPCTA